MLDHFNAASLAKLSKAELQSLLSCYQTLLNSAETEPERTEITAKLAVIKQALTL